eukprot:2159475-Pyramimonas_sp.AAC.1
MLLRIPGQGNSPGHRFWMGWWDLSLQSSSKLRTTGAARCNSCTDGGGQSSKGDITGHPVEPHDHISRFSDYAPEGYS